MTSENQNRAIGGSVHFTILSLLFACLFSVQTWAQKAYNPSETKFFDLIHTSLDIKPDWTTNHLEGKAELKLKPWFYPQSELILDAKGFDIHEVKLNGNTARFEYDKVKLNIHLDREYHRKDTLNIYVSYTAKPDELQSIPEFKDMEYKGLYFVNKTSSKPQQIWSEGETEYNSCWFPTLDSPNQKHTQDIRFTVPKEFTTLSNGLLTSTKENGDGTKTDHWVHNLEHSVYLTMIAAGEFSKVIDPASKKYEISYYVEPEYEKSALAIFGRTPEMISYFEDLLNVKYPWQKYAQIAVRDYVSGAMENTTATIHGSSIQKVANQIVDQNDDGVIAHELFHHWFGDLVTAESWANLPLNEAFADYSEHLWTAHKYGNEEAQWVNYSALNQYLDEADSKQVPVIRYGYSDKEDMFDSHSYAKGGRILHMLRQEVGDEAFFKALEVYLKANSGKNAELSDLRKAFEEVSGQDLNWFFDQWFLSPGHPRIHVEQEYKKGKLSFTFNQQLDSLNSMVYSFPLKVEIGTEDQSFLKTIRVDQPVQIFSFDLEEKPLFVSFDPYSDFLGVVDQKQSDKELQQQVKLSKGAIARAKAFMLLTSSEEEEEGNFAVNQMFDKAKREVALSALQDSYWRIREMATHKFFDYDGDDFLKVERALQSLIRTDAKSQVRAASILAMKNFLNPQNDLLFRKALTDTSYSVRAAALEALLISNPPDADSLATMMEDINDVNIFTAVANYKAAKSNPDDLDWFIKKMASFEGMELYQTMGVFGSYLITSGKDVQLKSIPFLENIAKNESLWIGRFAASQGLVLLMDLPEAITALKNIIALEKNEKLQELYRQLPID